MILHIYIYIYTYDLGLQGPPLWSPLASFPPCFLSSLLPSLLASFPELGFRGGYHWGGLSNREPESYILYLLYPPKKNYTKHVRSN